MASRGRQSASSLEIVGRRSARIAAVERPAPPADLSAFEADEWRAVVNRMPADWFPRETHAMLKQYCRHVGTADKIANMIKTVEDMLGVEAEELGIERGVQILKLSETLDHLYKMQEREGRAMTNLATKMRITQQSLFDKSKRRGKIGNSTEETGLQPWDE